jgi:hypothetical protein
MSVSKCLGIVNDMHKDDQEELLGILDDYIKDGVDPKKAQRMAVQDLLSKLEAKLPGYKPTPKARKYAGAKVDIQVKIEDTGEVATLRMDVHQTIDDFDSRQANMQTLLDCL